MDPYTKIGDAIAGLAPGDVTRALLRGVRGGRGPGYDRALEAMAIGREIERLERSMLPGCFAAVTGAGVSGFGWIVTDTARVQRAVAAGVIR